jgi:hypothetical protein
MFFMNSIRNYYAFAYPRRTSEVYYTRPPSLAGLVTCTLAFIFHNNKHYFAFKYLVNQRSAAPVEINYENEMMSYKVQHENREAGSQVCKYLQWTSGCYAVSFAVMIDGRPSSIT